MESSVGSIRGLALVVCGCDAVEGSRVTSVVSRDYEEFLAVPAAADAVDVLLGTTEYQGMDTPASGFVSTEPSPDASLKLRIRVVGVTLGAGRRAVIDSQCSGDTLRVWCGHDEPTIWEGTAESCVEDPWQQPYLIPRRMDIPLPAGVLVRYVG